MDISGMMKREEERNARRIESLTWDIIIAIDPFLDEVLAEIEKMEIDKKISIRGTWKRYREIMIHRVGFGAPEYAPELLKTSKAYDIVYEKLYNALGCKYNIPFQPMVRDSYCEE